eukprot:TRINITY_DN17382_c0_g1_i1.p1 TRINITY_DN17382_c0_g1~~TRINITY_DN17382_c0_g1_i1.p1  ORF type:complete len:131 (-),score=16.08 TRINITY_DN17382_c0_g1_i1:77-469(-)
MTNTYKLKISFAISNATNIDFKIPLTIISPQELTPIAILPLSPSQLPENVSYRRPWKDDSEIKAREKCKSKLSMVNKPKHCRMCASVFCEKCPSRKCVLPKLRYDHPVCVCNQYFPIAQRDAKKAENRKH